MHFLLTTLNVVHVLSMPMPTVSENGENESVEETRKQLKWKNDDYICRGHILNGMSDSLFDVYQNVESAKELWDALESKYMAEDASSKKFLVSDFNNYKMSDSRPVMEQYNELLRILGQFAQHNMKMDESISVSCIIDNHLRIEESLRVQEGGKPKDKEAETSSINMMEESGSSKMKNKGKKRPFTNNTNDGSNKRFKSICWICNKSGHFKRDCRAAKDKNKTQQNRFGQGSKDQGPSSHQGQNSVFDSYSKVYYVSKIAEAFYVQDDEVAWWIDSGATIHVCKDRGWFKTYEPVQDGSVLYMGNESTAPILGRGKVVLEFSSGKTLDLNDVIHVPGIRKNLVSGSVLNKCGFKQVYESDKYLLSKCGVFVGFGAIVRLPQPKIKTLGERGIDCIFIGYALHSKAYRFYVIEPNDSIAVHTVIESRDAIFDENRFSLIPRPKDLVPSSSGTKEGDDMFVPPNESPTLRKSKRGRIEKSFGPDFQLYLVEGSRDEIGFQYSYCYHYDDEPRTFSEAMTSNDVIFWKEAVNDEMDSIMGNNTWFLTDLPPGCKPLGCKWIFKKKMKVDGTIDKFKARLVVQGFRQKEGIDYFDTYAPVIRISSIRLLIGLASIHNLVIHQMDVKTAFLNGVLEEEVYMKQPEGFVMPGNEHKVCKLVKSLYGLKQAPKKWHQRFDEAILSNGFKLNQSDKCLYSKFDDSGNGVIICLYVDDMLIFGTNLRQVELTKEFLSSNFAMKDMGEAEVILGIQIKRENKGISLTQSHYIEKVLKKFNYENCSPVSTPMDASVKLMPNTGQAVSQLEYSRVIGCLMYAMTSTRPDIAYAVGKLSRYTSNPSTHHWQAVRRVLKYLKGTINYGLSYFGFPSVLEGYSDASWNTNEENHSSTSGWVFLLGGGAISWASKKQTCITNSTMESEFVALAAAGREAEWLRHLVSEIPLWPKPVSPISIHCDSQATLAKAYSQVYNGKSRHLGLRDSGIRELITHGVITIEFIRSQQNLADHLTKGLARDLVIKSAKGMGLKSI
ncbi:Zinc finger CCHC-type [Arabidopsis suecica]|uniref:Zinc finger CCHC-type n=1 Tax=Arabidopsis suecica TaxID=45249 RepID=A0A8T1YNT4_ARASU|nr:Zinc finger CCHC-type [Arabidopsis suecica]